MTTRNFMPLARAKDIIVQEADDECLVYDLNTHKALCLNSVSAEIWKKCDGMTAVQDVAEIIGKQMHIKLDEDFIWLAIADLEKNKLLENKVMRPTEFENLSRRKVLFKYALPSLILPIIASVIAPTAANAASIPPPPPCFGPGAVLGVNFDCGSTSMSALGPNIAACCTGMTEIVLLINAPPNSTCRLECT